jgi:hypothetical protein
MPIPKPAPNEDKQQFMNRCMSNDIMNSEYPDNKQRYAICLQQWNNKLDSFSMPLDIKINAIRL